MTAPAPAPNPVPLYVGALVGLYATLEADLAATHPGAIVVRRLRGGAEVSLRKDRQGRKWIRIARPADPPFPTENARRKWAGEVSTFLHHMNLGDWSPQATNAPNRAVALFREPAPGGRP